MTTTLKRATRARRNRKTRISTSGVKCLALLVETEVSLSIKVLEQCKMSRPNEYRGAGK